MSFPFPGSASRRLLHRNQVSPNAARVPGLRSHTADETRLVLHVSQPEKPFSTVLCCLGTLAPAAGHSTHEDSCSEKPVCGLQQGLRQRQTLGQHKPGRCSVGAAGPGCWGAAPFCAQMWLADPLPAPPERVDPCSTLCTCCDWLCPDLALPAQGDREGTGMSTLPQLLLSPSRSGQGYHMAPYR